MWVPSSRGRAMPLNAEPVFKRGIVVIDGVGQVIDAVYTSHFATCPYADEFRKKRG